MLQIKNLEVGYHSDPILKGINLTIQENEIHGLVGINGSGKTTLFRTINGWLPKWSGQVLFNEVPLKKTKISYLETEPYFFPYLKGKEYLWLLKKKNEKFIIDDWNRIFNLPLDHLADQYSTGMKKKLGLLGVLAQDRPVIILDEPLNGVDLESNIKFKEIFLSIKNKAKHILLSSHNITSLVEVCDRISILSDGVIMDTYEQERFADLQYLVESNIKNKVAKELDQLV